MAGQLLRFREGFKGPTNRACLAADRCEVIDYDLAVPANRKLLHDLGFICKVNGQRFKVDDESPRLRRDYYKQCGNWLQRKLGLKTCKYTQWLDATDVPYLRAAGTKCFNPKVFSFGAM